MDLKKINESIESSQSYQFFVRHKKVINIIEGFFIIGLLISLNIYVVKDHFIKKQIAEKCGYVDSTFKCVCEKHYVDNWQKLQKNNFELNLTGFNNVSMGG